MTQPLTDFISSVRTAESIEQERFIIATEQAQIRAYMRKDDPDHRPNIVSKLIFLDMLGQNTAWGQLETITLMSDERFSYKRVGYIGACVLLDEMGELALLVTQTLLKDLANNDPFIQSLALAFIANMGSQEVCRSVATSVQKLLDSRNPEVQKRAGMALVRIVEKNPDLAESYKNSVQSLLNQSQHGVVIAGINLVIAMIKAEPKLAKSWSQFAIPFTKILKSLTNSRPTREFSSGIYNDPFMQIKSMQALALLRKRSDELEGILQSIISSTENRRNTGRAILYQAVETVVAVSKKSALRGLAFNQVGRLLSMKDPNVLYSALSSFARVLYSQKAMISRGSADSMALQRYKTQIVNCLDHKDPSIRRRALDVISALIDEKNVTTLIPEILSFVKLADTDFRSELIAKIYQATQRFAPDVLWNFDTVHQILIDSGNYVSSDIISSFCELITKTPKLQQHAVTKLSESLLHFSENQSLMQVSAFVIGEFAMEDNGTSETFRQIVILPQTSVETKLYIITALSKMAVRFGGDRTPTLQLLADLSRSNNLEVQQRSGEMLQLLQIEGVAEELLAPIAAIADTEIDEKAVAINDQPATAKEDDDLLSLLVLDNKPQQTQQPQQAQNTASNPLDLLNLAPAPQPQQQQQQNSAAIDLLGLSTPPQPQQAAKPAPAPTPAQAQPQQPQLPQLQPQGIKMLEFQDLVLYGQVRPNPQQPNQYALKLSAYNKSKRELSGIKIAVQPSPGWQLKSQPADGDKIGPSFSSCVSLLVYLFNPSNTPFALNVKISYYFGSQPVNETGIIRSLQ